jgi:hypothetical protein
VCLPVPGMEVLVRRGDPGQERGRRLQIELWPNLGDAS